jgi:hypothetical protein
MTGKREKPPNLDIDFDEALKRFIQADPGEVAEAIAGGILKKHKEAQKRIERVRKELEDGARPRKGRFRL